MKEETKLLKSKRVTRLKGTQSEAIQSLISLKMDKGRQERPSLPDFARITPMYEDQTSNGLTRCIIDFLNMMEGCHAERISSEGRVIDDRKTFENVIGQKVTTGNIKRIKTSAQRGTADILGRSVKIEVKVGSDRQSEAQKEYQRQIENAKGYYLLVKDFQGFYDWFNSKYQKANE